MLTMRILLRAGQLSAEEASHLIIGKSELNPPPTPDALKSFINDNIWAACKALEAIPAFSSLCQSLETDVLQWKKWYNEANAEVADLPKAFKEITKFHRLLLLRAIRPDRVTSALTYFVGDTMGERYIEQ